MTATRIVRGATLAAGALAWVFLAVLLWRTTVPHFDLPHLEESRVFRADLVRRAQHFERLLVWDWVAATVVALAAYVFMVRRGRELVPRLGLSSVNAGIVIAVVVFAVVWAATLPFAFVALWWERRHGVSFESYGSALAGAWGQLLARTLVAVVALAIILLLARRFPRSWWLPSGLALAAILFVLQLITPYAATIGTHPPPDWLRNAAHTLERREHAGNPTVRVDVVSNRTNEENAFSIGIGPTEHVIIWDTLLRDFSHADVRFVLAHELGHIARNHVLRGVGWFALLVLPVLIVVSRIANVRRAELVPLALLVVALARIALLPLENAISRRYESEADWFALQGTRDPAADKRVFTGFVRTSLQDPSPPGWVHVLLDNHPSPLQRVEMARAWSGRR